MNLVEKANKVMSFRKLIREECRKNHLEYPSDEKISQYINEKYGMNVADFMADYKEREGIFREPISDFCKELGKYEFGNNKPTLEEIKDWTSKNGYDVSLFLRERTINSYEGFYRKTIENALKLDEKVLVDLWNYFIEESAWYGEDSHIFDLAGLKDCQWLADNLSEEDFRYICELVKLKNNVRYIQVLSQDGEPKDSINIVNDIKGIIVAYWTDIVDRVMSFADLYYENCNTQMMGIFQPAIREMLGISYKENNY